MRVENATFFDAAALPLTGPRGENLLTVMVKGTFSFSGGRSQPADEQIPKPYGDNIENE
jgi:hypothetical protein